MSRDAHGARRQGHRRVTPTELGAKGSIEVGDIAEAAVECEVEDRLPMRGEPHGGFSQSRPQQVLVRVKPVRR